MNCFDGPTTSVTGTWDEALDAIGPRDEPQHVARFGDRFDAQGVIAGSKDAARCIGYLTKYPTKHVADCHHAETHAQAQHAAQIADAVRCAIPVQRCACQQPVPGAAAVLQMARQGGADPGRSFAPRRDAAVIAVLKASWIRAGELAGIRYDPHDASGSDLDLQQREITVRGKGGGSRIVKIGHEAARAVDRYIRIRSKHAQAWRHRCTRPR